LSARPSGRLSVFISFVLRAEPHLFVCPPQIIRSSMYCLPCPAAVPVPAVSSVPPPTPGFLRLTGARPYMEDRHTVVASFVPLGAAGLPLNDGVYRSFAGVYDGHNGAKSAEECAARLHMVGLGRPALPVLEVAARRPGTAGP
jgi:hypothetical protein